MNPGWRIIDCSQLEGSLTYSRGNILVKPESNQTATSIPLAQIAVVLVGTKTIISGAVIGKLSEYDIALLVCDWRQVPIAGAFPWADHTRIGARQQAQANLSVPKRKRAWASIVSAKVLGQTHTAESLTDTVQPELRQLGKTVRSGDPDNIEAQAARRYWSIISESNFSRRLPGAAMDPWNSALDYGYTVLRGYGIRAITSAGLIGSLGVFHRGRSNSFNLVDDIIEPCRPLVDHIVFSQLPLESELTKEAKQTLVQLLGSTPFLATGETVGTHLEQLAQSFGLYVEGAAVAFKPLPWLGPFDAENWN